MYTLQKKTVLNTQEITQLKQLNGIDNCLAIARFMRDVFMPMVDYGLKTEVVVSDSDEFYRIQVKAIVSDDEGTVVENKWGKASIDYVICFSRTGN